LSARKHTTSYRIVISKVLFFTLRYTSLTTTSISGSHRAVGQSSVDLCPEDNTWTKWLSTEIFGPIIVLNPLKGKVKVQGHRSKFAYVLLVLLSVFLTVFLPAESTDRSW